MSDLVGNPEDQFSHVAAHMIRLVLNINIIVLLVLLSEVLRGQPRITI